MRSPATLVPDFVRRSLPSTRSNYVAGLLFDLFVREYRVDDLKFVVPMDLTTRQFRSRFFFRNYEHEEQSLIKRYLAADATVLELGACIGIVSCITNKLLNKPERHVVVEANPHLVETLELNRVRNRCAFEIRQGIISNQSEAIFHLHDLIIGGSTYRKTGVAINVPTLTIEMIEAQAQLRFDTLIMDIECGEYEFLQQNTDFLRRVDTVFVEIHDHIFGRETGDRCRQMLLSAGLTRIAALNISEVWRRELV